MGRKISKQRVKELCKQDELRSQGKVVKQGRTEKRQKVRINKKKRWTANLIERGGFTPKRAKKWGDACSLSECPKSEDGECAYQKRDTQGCYMVNQKVVESDG